MEVFDILGNKVKEGDRVVFVSYESGKIPKYFTQGWAEVIEITNRGTVVYQHNARHSASSGSAKTFLRVVQDWLGRNNYQWRVICSNV